MSIEVVSHAMRFINVTEKALKTAARMIGGSLEGHAKELCPVDTGLLRNSITFALGGEAPNISQYASTKKDAEGNMNSGVYDGTAEKDDDHQITVYVGTNVEYAPFVELGHSQEAGRYVPAIGKKLKASEVKAKPFLRPAMENNKREILQIIEKCCKEIR